MVETNPLSPREAEILELVAKGLTNREIAQKLSISPNTVKVHLSNIFEKANVSSRTEATLYGMTHGLVDVPEGATDAVPSEQPQPTIFQRSPWAWVVLGALLVALIFVLRTLIINRQTAPEGFAVVTFADRWQPIATLPAPRSHAALTAYDGNIFVIGGEDEESVSGSVFTYQPDSDQWVDLASKPLPVADVQSVLIGEKIYVPGGRMANGETTTTLEVYNPRLNQWTEGASLPKAISDYGLTSYEGKMFLFGGWDGARVSDEVLIYDPIENTWGRGTHMPIAKSGVKVAQVGGKIYVLGGQSGETRFNTMDVYLPARENSGDDPWQPLTPFNENVRSLALEPIGNLLFLIVQREADEILVYSYQAEKDEWFPSPERLLIPVDTWIVSALDDHLYLFGTLTGEDGVETIAFKYKALYINLIPNIEY